MTQPGQGEQPAVRGAAAKTPAPAEPLIRWLPATAWVNWCGHAPVCTSTATWHAIIRVDPFGGG
jgi:hypothetical protein